MKNGSVLFKMFLSCYAVNGNLKKFGGLLLQEHLFCDVQIWASTVCYSKTNSNSARVVNKSFWWHSKTKNTSAALSKLFLNSDENAAYWFFLLFVKNCYQLSFIAHKYLLFHALTKTIVTKKSLFCSWINVFICLLFQGRLAFDFHRNFTWKDDTKKAFVYIPLILLLEKNLLH